MESNSDELPKKSGKKKITKPSDLIPLIHDLKEKDMLPEFLKEAIHEAEALVAKKRAERKAAKEKPSEGASPVNPPAPKPKKRK